MGEWDFGDFGYDPNTDYFAPNYFAPLNEDYGGSYFTPRYDVPNLTDYFAPGEVDYQDYFAPTAGAPRPGPGERGSAVGGGLRAEPLGAGAGHDGERALQPPAHV